jgi:hypothetical protein
MVDSSGDWDSANAVVNMLSQPEVVLWNKYISSGLLASN